MRIRMPSIEKSLLVKQPLRVVYNQWTQFEEFSLFMEGVREVKQLSERRIRWRVLIGTAEKEWLSEIIEQVPDTTIAWHSVDGVKNSGRISFEAAADNSTLIKLQIDYEPHGLWEQVGDALGMVEFRIEEDLGRFKKFIEARGASPGAWRGTIKAKSKRTKKSPSQRPIPPSRKRQAHPSRKGKPT
jgi:uncharacterized membrane protein